MADTREGWPWSLAMVATMIGKLLQTEPAALIAAVTALVGAAVSLGLLTQPRAAVWIALVAGLLPVVLPIIQGYLTRQTVFAHDTVQRIANDATNLAPGTEVDIGKPPEGEG